MTGWSRVPFSELVADVSAGNLKTPLGDYLREGLFPVVDQGKSLVGGYTNDPSVLCKSPSPVIVFGDHTRCVKFVDFPFGMGADGVKVLRVSPTADPKFLYHYLRQLRLPDEGYSRHFKHLKRAEIPVPPIEKQRAIAAILDQAETLGVHRRASIDQLDKLPQALFLQMFGDPIRNPKRWPVASLSDVCHLYSGGTPSKQAARLWQGNLPWFSAKDLKADDLFDSRDHIWEGVPQESPLRLLPVNTVAIVVRGMILAHTFPVSVLRVQSTINQDLKALLPRKPIHAQFLAACLRAQSRFVLEQVSEAGHGTKRLDAEALRKVKILLPETGLQKKFAARVRAIELLRGSHIAALGESDALVASLQHRAFSGQL